ncbi:MAG: NAD-dependent epimerase/dehydratase family protein, partial [Bacteroidales bacterium]|nr:NAD-dependent epimerase/dehydratase family protein [Bacteroidales bacterium]
MLTGSFGQIGSDLTCALRKIYGGENVIATDLSTKVTDKIKNGGPFEQLDVLDGKKLAELIDKYQVDGIFHLAAILSAVGEKNPALAWNINMQGT